MLALKSCKVEFCNKQASARLSSSIYNYTNIEGLLTSVELRDCIISFFSGRILCIFWGLLYKEVLK